LLRTAEGWRVSDDRHTTFLARLWELQAEAGLSDSALAEQLGVSQSYVSRLRSGDRGQRLTINIVGRAVHVFRELASFLPA
jgi:transcriptional regulator with XRE-family HTH domain